MKSIYTISIYIIVLLFSVKQYAQQHSKMNVEVDMLEKKLKIKQQLTFFNQSADTLTEIVLNDWNNAYSDKDSPLGKRFSDEYYRAFHMAVSSERGGTEDLFISDSRQKNMKWERTKTSPDYIIVKLNEKLAPNEKVILKLTYISKIPIDKFTKYGYTANGSMILKNWFLTPSRYENHSFIRYSNENLDDIANASSDFDIDLKVPDNFGITTDLELNEKDTTSVYKLTGSNRCDFSLFIEPESSFKSFKNENLEIATNLKAEKLSEIQMAILIDRISKFTDSTIGTYPYPKIIISQADYDRNPFYGLNQLPAFMSPFTEEFKFEIKFLKTYLNTFLKNSLRLDSRKDNWIYDAIQVYYMMQYIDAFHQDSKMMGSASKYLLAKGFRLAQMDFNEQYSYYYLLMARKNLDQPLGSPKNSLIKFNVQIANKYHAGLSLKYLDDYLENLSVPNAIKQFYTLNKDNQTTRNDFETILKSNTTKDINWFFNYVIDSREMIDYKFANVSKTKDSVSFSLKSKTCVAIPFPVYGIKKKEVVFKKWIDIKNDSTYTLERKDADKIVLNYNNEVPEFKLGNNWKSLKPLALNRPIKFTFFEDIEDPHYNQILYVPTIAYNLYDGFMPGMSFSNSTILDKKYVYSLNPMYSSNTKSLVGSYSVGLNQQYRSSSLYNVRYSLGGSYYHYAPDAAYLKLNPSVSLSFREKNYRDNRKQGITFKYNIINKENSAIVQDTTDNYSILDVKYYSTKTEVTNHVRYTSDLQISGQFGKVSGDIQYRKLFNDNRQINFRLFAGTFLYNKTGSDDYNFGLERPNDYLFEYNLFARSETTGFLSQQFVLAEGGFKTFLVPSSANKWMITTNLSFNVWNWVEVYGDLGLVKNNNASPAFLYDSGIRLNLVTDYFELYFPVYSSNGWDIGQKNYNEKIRFVFTFSPKSLISLFTRKWF